MKPFLFTIYFLTASLFVLPLSAFCQQATGSSAVDLFDSTIMYATEKPVLISRQFSFTEGPAADKNGNIFFTDQPNNKIWKYATNGELSVFSDDAGRANGLYFDKKGNLLACADANNQLWRIQPNGKAKVLVKDFKGYRLNGPNDVWVHANGNIYFTDPFYQRSYWPARKDTITSQDVYLLSKNGKQLTTVAQNLGRPNGIIGNNETLYVSDIKAGKIYKYHINHNGTLADQQLFAEAVADGMTMDEKGNVYLAGNGITVFNAQGHKIAHIAIPENWTANVTFGGKDHRLLFITASQGIYALKMKVKGAR
ncbi:MAG: SMP-30/gluconolactonase/LRE family protein [Flavisolibacter sp.]